MKKSACYSAAALSLLLVGQAIAAVPSTTLKVAGQFGEMGCQIALSGESGELKWESVSPSLLHPTKPLPLPGKSKMVNVNCEQATPLSFLIIDNRKGTSDSSDPQHFGLGNVNQTGKVGHYEAAAAQIKINGEPADLTAKGYSKPGQWHNFTPGEVVYWSKSGKPYPAKSFSFELGIHPYLASLNDMGGVPVEGENLLDGSMTLEFGFGV
ncbi:TPA: hypothetical protein ACXNDR_001436 [Serratia marcescens]